MAVESIGLVSGEFLSAKSLGGIAKREPSGFTVWLDQQVSVVNNQLEQADIQVQRLALGETDNLHQVMMAITKAKLQFELVVQVRNKLLEGYQEIMRMQV